MKPLLTWLFGYLSLLAPCFAQYATVGANSCGLGQNNCHAQENNWWTADKHFLTNERFYNSNKSGEIARAYGLTLAEAKRSNSTCMTCHGTTITAELAKNPAVEPEYGVSCENCHGPGSGYKVPHAVKDSAYAIGIRLGMKRNRSMPVRAKMCVDCHMVKDKRLLAAGHPTGERFNYKSGLKQVAAHFRTPDSEAERTAFFAAVETAKRSAGVTPAFVAAATPAVSVVPKKIPSTPLPKAPSQRKAEPKPLAEADHEITDAPPVDDSSAVVTIDIIATEAPSATQSAAPMIMPEPQFVPPPMPIMPMVKPRKPLVLPPFPERSLKNAKTHADSIAVLENYLNALLRATRP